MAAPDATLYLRVPNISSLRHQVMVMSPQPTYIRNLAWRIQVGPLYEGRNMGDTWLGVYVQCEDEEMPSNWSCKAFINIRVMPQYQRVRAFSKDFTRIFHSNGDTWGYAKFMKWPLLMDYSMGYIQYDYIDVEIDVTACMPLGLTSHLKEVQVLNLDSDSRSHATLRFKVKNISSLSKSVSSQQVMISNLPWRVIIGLNQSPHTYESGALVVYLTCDGDWSPNWTCLALVSTKLIPQKPGTTVYLREFARAEKFAKASPTWGYGDFIDWWSLVDPVDGYVNEKEDFIELEITVITDPSREIKQGCQQLGNKVLTKDSVQMPDVTISTDHLCCPICLDWPRDEVYQCRNGHTICDKCIVNQTTCPQCRVRLEDANARIRNRVLEGILDSLHFECRYRQNGCTVEKLKKELVQHEQACVFQYA